MSHDASTRTADAKAIVLMIALLAGAVGLIGLVLDHLAIGPVHAHPITHLIEHPIASAQAAVPTQARPANKISAVVPRVEEVWNADESAQGTRSDAAH